MSAHTNESSASFTNEDLAYGHKVIGYALQCLAWGCTVAVAVSCSSILMGIVMLIIMSFVMALLTALLQMLVLFKVPAVHVAGLGRTVGGAAARVTSVFKRKAATA